MSIRRAGSSALRARLAQVARTLDLYAVPAYLTDPLNRVVVVNRQFASLVGDPLRDGIAPDDRFVPALIVGPYRERFPGGERDVAACLPSLDHEVGHGRLQGGALRLAERLRADPRVRQIGDLDPWSGVLIVRDDNRRLQPLREQVVPVAGAHGQSTGFHISAWVAAEDRAAESARTILTPRQLQIARMYAQGLTSVQVAERAGIARSTARDHLEQIYTRLHVHSRAELGALLARERLDTGR